MDHQPLTLSPLMLLPLAAVLASACTVTERGPFVFDSPTTSDVLRPSDGGPFDEPIGFVSNLRSGRITPLDLKHATLLSDQPTAPWLHSRGIALGDERQLGDIIVWAPADDQVRVMAVDLAHQVLVEAPYITGFGTALELFIPTATDPVFDDADASGDTISASNLLLSTGWTTTEDWLFDYDGEKWWVTGTRSGQQSQQAYTGQPYRTDNLELSLTLQGTATAGDRLTLSTDTGVVEHDVGAMPLTLKRVPGQNLALVGTWDAATDSGALVVWDLVAQAMVGSVDLGPGSQPWAIELATVEDDVAQVYVADSSLAVVHALELNLMAPETSLLTDIDTAAPVQDVAWLSGQDYQGQPFNRLFVAPVGLNRIDLYDLDTNTWHDVNPMDDVDAAGIDLFSPVVGLDAAPDPINVQTLTQWGVWNQAAVVVATLFDGSLVMVDAATGCLVTDIQGALVDPTNTSGAFYDLGAISNPAIQTDDATGREVVTSPCGGLMRSESWTITFDGATGDWLVDGSLSGPQANRLHEDERYVSDNGGFSMLILSGPLATTDGDEFQYTSTEGVLRLNSVTDSSTSTTTFDAPGKPLVFQYDVGPTGGGWDVLDRRTFALLPLIGNDLVLRVRLESWNVEVVWE
ncbi:MAG: hypothetical protein GXP62_09460 [Oligoflexia bacterium]|nr:hypothetical protein [Oligoflexia bacterium]